MRAAAAASRPALSPGVTIGVPVFNGAQTLRRAVASALAQTRPVDVIHVSDNASTDGTGEVGRALAAAHPRVRYTRHDTSLGMSGNFGFVLRAARTEYFMWLAADDCLEPVYVERMLEHLRADPGLSACVSQVRLVAGDGATRLAGGTYRLVGDVVGNLAAYLSWPSDNSRIFGVYRTEALQASFPPRYFHAYDWAIAAGTLLHGGHMEVPEPLMTRDDTPRDSYVRRMRADHASNLGRLFPLVAMTSDIVLRLRVPLRWPVIKALIGLNLDGHLTYVEMHHPRYWRMVDRFMRTRILWRFTMPRPAPEGAGGPAGSG